LALAWPDRVKDAAPGLDWSTASTWEFASLDSEAFPAVELARRAGAAGGTAPAVFNAANAVAVEQVLRGRTPFLAIVDTIALVLDEHLTSPVGGIRQEASSLTVDAVLHADRWARQRAAELLESRHGAGQTEETLDQGAQ
ncbi:MAG TPA: hypothetical protein VFX15_09190, partial [Actinomycetes bacterium]|nr:hypothetical protein [Actinomycetes bacterium]